MIIVETKLCVVDNSGAKLAKCVKVIGKSSKQKASVGSIILVTLKKFTNRKKVQKSLIYIGLVVGVCYWNSRKDGSYIKFFNNRILIFNKQFKFLGSRIYGTILKEVKMNNLKEKKYQTYFHKIITYSSFII